MTAETLEQVLAILLHPLDCVSGGEATGRLPATGTRAGAGGGDHQGLLPATGAFRDVEERATFLDERERTASGSQCSTTGGTPHEGPADERVLCEQGASGNGHHSIHRRRGLHRPPHTPGRRPRPRNPARARTAAPGTVP